MFAAYNWNKENKLTSKEIKASQKWRKKIT